MTFTLIPTLSQNILGFELLAVVAEAHVLLFEYLLPDLPPLDVLLLCLPELLELAGAGLTYRDVHILPQRVEASQLQSTHPLVAQPKHRVELKQVLSPEHLQRDVSALKARLCEELGQAASSSIGEPSGFDPYYGLSDLLSF